MRAVDIIEKKRDKKEITNEEISFLLSNYLNEEIPDYQMAAFLMAVYFNGMTDAELLEFTKEMRDSGDVIDFDGLARFHVDKHSTGGVGDKVTIALEPIMSALGMGSTKLSGKGLGHTGGTIDKFEAIKGFRFSNTKEEVIEIANKTGIGLMGYSDKIVPLDKKLYSLRDVTATVASIPLIASSIMSKKLAIHSDAIILDVKTGNGAFMKTLPDAVELARTMLKIGKGFDRKIVAVISNMDQPLGCAVGNANEVIEAIETLKGNGPEDFTELVYNIAALALKLKGDVNTLEEGMVKVKEVVDNRSALEKFALFIKESGGDPEIVNDYSLLPAYSGTLEVKSEEEGYVSQILAEEIGKAAMIIGAGRATKEDEIDHSVGVLVLKKVGDFVKKGDVIAKICYNDSKYADNSKKMILGAYKFSKEKVEKPKIIFEILEA
ncbi:thymidine phosphorylase [Sebaldella sp. S0638]|uniref:thymidine phosphorylase n=1 Tax=Sebaldella sp. S0638 TaxID=2957809 RepID=UPI0020A0CD0D|nr:thymidine phosphorylase [Sebaldella sp. S0638]MCP1224658.1 thymidine phosphorylase [Sebaldella sp. S0638]